MPSNYCDKVGQCRNSWWCAIDYKPVNKDCFDQITNADRIRAMSDYDLADFLCQIMDNCLNFGSKGNCQKFCPMYYCCNDQASDTIEDWLNAPAEVKKDDP